VLNTDDPRLLTVADRLAHEGPPAPAVLRCSASLSRELSVNARAVLAGAPPASSPGDPGPGRQPPDVAVARRHDLVDIEVGGRRVAEGVAVPQGVRASNLACAVAAAVRLGVAPEAVADRVATLPQVANRLTEAVAPSGVTVLDDTYNSNPAGARAALRALGAGPEGGRRVLVTPGMVELGRRQFEANEELAAEAEEATDLVVVGLTNRRALLQGWASRPGRRGAVCAATREEAVAWVRRHLGPGDRVLYENDLPDHYP
jgi:UDP-N-acetylmuramoyl-tripeptide--D-alanyl-D-alanine ligase